MPSYASKRKGGGLRGHGTNHFSLYVIQQGDSSGEIVLCICKGPLQRGFKASGKQRWFEFSSSAESSLTVSLLDQTKNPSDQASCLTQ